MHRTWKKVYFVTILCKVSTKCTYLHTSLQVNVSFLSNIGSSKLFFLWWLRFSWNLKSSFHIYPKIQLFPLCFSKQSKCKLWPPIVPNRKLMVDSHVWSKSRLIVRIPRFKSTTTTYVPIWQNSKLTKLCTKLVLLKSVTRWSMMWDLEVSNVKNADKNFQSFNGGT